MAWWAWALIALGACALLAAIAIIGYGLYVAKVLLDMFEHPRGR